MNLSIIIPLYNEENLICKTIQKVLDVQMPTFVETVEIIIVDDCSTDRSNSVVTAFIANKPNIKFLKHAVNKGKGAAVRTGITDSSGDVFLIQDADLELSPVDIPLMVETMYELNVGFINGSRYLPGVYRPLSSYRRYLFNKLFTLMTSVLINVRLTDMACGYKLFTRELYNKLHLKENRFGFEAELIIKAMRIRKNNIAEVPVRYFPRNEGEGKKLKNIDGLRIFKTIFKYGVLKLN
ncbi:glycosyltransferase family 2 protein [uncultured Cytophaga sp.]|uniref:glycosyltransferase family 2 protein n=1 Tax=uncultured Cytophaga sp. TaxID=160238 RepID=UPI002635D24C|nr:glycosyltransferase family 2 protein [uncultured Cytophaga sp.]